MRGYVLINTKSGTSEEVTQSFKEMLPKNVHIGDSVFGSYDVILVMEAKNLEEFGSILYEIVEKNSNIIRTETCVVLPTTGSEK